MRKPKITVVGAGDLGAATAQRLAANRLGDIVVLDVGDTEGPAPHGERIVRARDDGDTAGSDILIVTAGAAPAPGNDGDARRDANARIVGEGVSRAVRKSRDSIIIMVTEPVAVLCEAARRVSGFPRQRVLGAARLDPALVRALAASDPGRFDGGGGARSGPAPVVRAVELADAVINDRKIVLPCAVYLQGEFGVTGVFLGVAATVGAAGVEGVVEPPLTAEERAQLHRRAGEITAQSARLPADLGSA